MSVNENQNQGNDSSRKEPAFGKAVSGLDGCELRIVPDLKYPHLIEVWEPLETKAPAPNKTQPYCCYINTVIFYLRPYIVRPWHHYWICNGKRKAERPGTTFEEWDRIETRLHHDSIVEFNGRKFQVYNGRVRWMNRRWWMKRDARAIGR